MKNARITGLIHKSRGYKVLLDRDLATLYGVDTRVLNQAVSRNIDRFPNDFMFQLTGEEVSSLRSQFVILKNGRGRHRKYLPYAFTEQGVAMLSSVLRSSRAIQVNIGIMRAFVWLRENIAANRELADKIGELERSVSSHDQSIRVIFETIRQLMEKPVPEKRRIGFGVTEE